MKNSSIHHSNSRIVAVHATDYTTFENNVAFQSIGHGVFLEDGSEQFNVFRGNLVMATQLPSEESALLPSDRGPRGPASFQNQAPAAFWITNPNNEFEGNVVAGIDGTGYWFALPSQWMGRSALNAAAAAYFDSRTPPGATGLEQMPFRQKLGKFNNNSCHSALMAIDLNDSIATTPIPGFSLNDIMTNIEWIPYTGQTEDMLRFHCYSCNVGIYTGNGRRHLRFVEAALADNSWQIVLASHDVVKDSVVWHDSQAQHPQRSLWSSHNTYSSYFRGEKHRSIAVVLYDGATELDNVHFRGFDIPFNPNSLSLPHATFAWAVGAGRRHTGAPMSGLNFSTAGGAATPPLLDFDDVSGMDPGGGYALGGPRDPRSWAFSIDCDATLIPGVSAHSGNPPLTTVISNHDFMRTGRLHSATSTPWEIPLGSATPPRAYASPFRYAYLRVQTTDDLGRLPAEQSSTAPWYDLRYTRDTASGGSAAIYDNRWRTDDVKQMAVIVDRQGESYQYRYALEWFEATTMDPSTATPPTTPRHTQMWLAEMRDNESALIGFRGYPLVDSAGRSLQVLRATSAPGPVNHTSSGLVTVNRVTTALGGLPALYTATETSWFWDSSNGGTVWLKIIASTTGNAPAIPIQYDGRGQLILLDY